MTEKNLRKALAAILKDKDNLAALRELYDDQESDDEKIIRKAVNELFSKKLLRHINASLKFVPVFSIEDENFKALVKAYDKQRDKEETGPIFDYLDEIRIAIVCGTMGDYSFIGETMDSPNGIEHFRYSETYVTEDGDLFCALRDVVKYGQEIHHIRKTDENPWSLADLEAEGFFPEKFNGFWTDA